MRDFRSERKDQRATRRKQTARIGRLTRYMIRHYLLLVLSAVIACIALFVVINYPGPYKEVLALLLTCLLILGLYILFSGIEK